MLLIKTVGLLLIVAVIIVSAEQLFIEVPVSVKV
jgi:hypothetical protein